MRPNQIFIVADDLGYADLGCYGGRNGRFGPPSPHLDDLARGGLRLTDGYSNSPVCSPTRVALMTMRYQYRVRGGMEEPINTVTNRDAESAGLPPGAATLPRALREAGYATALIGKWHLGYPPHFGPLLSGYDRFYGIMAGGADYFSHRSGRGQKDLYIGHEEHDEPGYLTDLLSRRAVDYVREMASAARAGRPFFLSLHYTAPHWPWQTRDDEGSSTAIGNRLAHTDSGSVETYLRMIHHMDEGIGGIVAALSDERLLDETLIVFTSDNGGERFSDNWPHVGGKMDLTEGGIRVPWIAHWPAVVPAGSVSGQAAMTMDWSRTMLEVGGARPDPDQPPDGVSLLPVLREPAASFENPLFWRMKHRDQRALRRGRWKYLKVEEDEYLFDVVTDGRERASRAAAEPARFEALRDEWLAWNETMPPIPEDASVTTAYSRKEMPQR